jgi:hypothetical protein
LPAAAPRAADVPKPESRVEWYAGKLVAADAISLITFYAGAQSESASALPALGLGGYLLAAPIIHATEGRPAVALGSFMLRLGLPIVGATVASMTYKSEQDDHCDCMGDAIAVIGGLAVGMLVAMPLDYLLLGHKRVQQPKKRVSLLPTFTVAQQGASFGVAGRF